MNWPISCQTGGVPSNPVLPYVACFMCQFSRNASAALIRRSRKSPPLALARNATRETGQSLSSNGTWQANFGNETAWKIFPPQEKARFHVVFVVVVVVTEILRFCNWSKEESVGWYVLLIKKAFRFFFRSLSRCTSGEMGTTNKQINMHRNEIMRAMFFVISWSGVVLIYFLEVGFEVWFWFHFFIFG